MISASNFLQELKLTPKDIPFNYNEYELGHIAEIFTRTDRVLQEWALTSVEHVLPIFEEENPLEFHDNRVRRAVEAGQAYLRAEISMEKLDKAINAISRGGVGLSKRGDCVEWAVKRACRAAKSVSSRDIVFHVSGAIRWAAEASIDKNYHNYQQALLEAMLKEEWSKNSTR